MIKYLRIGFVVVFCLTGCVSVSKNLVQQYDIMVTRLESLRFAPQPSQAQIKDAFKAYAKRHEADPYSIRDFAITSSPEQCAYMSASSVLYPRDTFDLPSWCTAIEYNAKNTYGAYAGMKRYVFVMQKDKSITIAPKKYNQETLLSGWASVNDTLVRYKKDRQKAINRSQ